MTTRHKWADVIIAYAEGKEIQCATIGYNDWVSVGDSNTCDSGYFPSFGASNLQWRIKPEVKTGWLVMYKSGTISCRLYENKPSVCDRTKETISAMKQITYTEGEGLE